MKIVCISDTHNKHRKIDIPDGDILIHSGDFSSNIKSIYNFNDWIRELPHKYKIVIAGNNDFIFEKDPQIARNIITNAIYLEDSGIEINGFNIWGSPVTPRFLNKAFNRNRGKEIKKHWDMIPLNTDILITHTPPYKILDQNFFGKHLGCEELRNKVDVLKPKIHIFGHIHNSHGVKNINNTIFVNASSLNELYLTVKPIVIDIT